MKPKVLVLCANGSEEMEVIIPVDMLRRGGVDVTLASIHPGIVTGSRGIQLLADAVLDENMQADALVLPGGLGGVEAFLENPLVHRVVKAHAQTGAWICAICAAPLVLQACGLLDSIDAFTSHPGVQDRFASHLQKRYSESRVVVSGKILTSRAPGTAFEFAAAILRLLQGENVVNTVHRNVLYLT